MIRRKNGKYCVMSEDGNKSFGCYEDMAAAEKRLSQIEQFKHMESYLDIGEQVWLDVEDMKIICEDCSKHMQEANLAKVNLTKILEAIPEKNIDKFIEAMSSDNCVKMLSSKIGDKRAKSVCDMLKMEMKESVKTLSFSIDSFQFLESKSKDGSEWEVVIMEEGKSKNPEPRDFYYTREALENLAPLVESANANAYEFKGHIKDLLDHLPDKIREAMPKGLASNVVGRFKNARVGEFIRKGKKKLGLLATFIPTANWVKESLKNAWEKGIKNLYGFSIDAYGPQPVLESINGAVEKAVKTFSKLNEVTLVTEGAAATGNQFLRLLNSNTTVEKLKEIVMRDKLLQLLKQKAPHILESKDVNALTDEELFKLVESALPTEQKKEPKAKKEEEDDDEEKKGGDNLNKQEIQEAVSQLIKDSLKPVLDTVNKITESQNLVQKRELLEEKLKESKLPDAHIARLRKSFKNRDWNDDDLNAEIKLEQDMAAKYAESGNVQGLGAGFKITSEQEDDFRVAMDGFFEGEAQKNEKTGKKVRPFMSLREAYKYIVGDPWADANAATILQESFYFIPKLPDAPGFKESYDYRRRMAMREAMKTNYREALTTSSFGELLGDSVTRKMIKEYTLDDKNVWRNVVSDISPISDFRTQRRMKLGGYGTLPTVSEAGTYNPLTSATDAEETYAISKKGGLENLTIEMIANDDVGAIRKIPVRLARAAVETLYRGVFNAITDNPTMGEDSITLFNSSHNNTGTTALTDAELGVVRYAMRSQTAYGNSSEVLGQANAPKLILVPNELETTAWELTASPVKVESGNDATVPNIHTRLYSIMPIVVDFWTDANNWYAVADPKKQPTIEVGFFQGRQEPELFVSDNPLVGSNSTADKITYKIRHIWGTVVLDWRSFYREVVT